ncbi:hypothetical protein F511_38940 [Dorcoceras hygrometricum]|uniref:Bromo domain-containing protein n=1 Tax=Dorcoceras hygrometricum TaxID=472368 RepID=A0A2Z7BNZ0_9LAMI|nr:hypothetical protein F511_38940 [Dorcoceras hygrometricum]
MGKVAETAAATPELKRNKRKKKGRPPKASYLLSTPIKPTNSVSNPSSDRRSGRRSHSLDNLNEFDDEDEDERKEKKVKLVVRLPESNEEDIDQKQSNNRRRSRDYASCSGSDFDPNSDDQEGSDKKRKIATVDRGSNHADFMQEKKVSTVAETLHGSPMESGPTTPLPDRTLLVFILDRLQKKDVYGVFSEPVDPNELPDYGEIIEHPMDFGTVRKKLDGGAYKNLEELETDVFLICSNAMTYNAPDTIYYRQARSIQELAKRDFENLKHEGDDGELQPKVVRRGRPPSKNQKKPVDTSPLDRVSPDPSSVALLAGTEEKIVGSNTYNLRKVPTPQRFRYTTDPSNFRSRNGENSSEWLSDWSDFPASIVRADMKYGNKQFTVDENRRDTYGQYNPESFGNKLPALSNSYGNLKRLVPVGLHEPLAYARSLAKYAANLGPIAWIVASRKIESVLPSGIQYGPGWVGEKVTPSHALWQSFEKEKSLGSVTSYFNTSKPATPSTPAMSSAVENCTSAGKLEAARKPYSQNELAAQDRNSTSVRTEFETPENPIFPSHKNGFHGMFGYNVSAVTNPKLAIAVHPVMNATQMVETELRNEPSTHPSSTNHVIIEAAKLTENRNTTPVVSQTAQGIIRQTLSIPPDLNVKVAAGSPTSSLHICSPQQPDLALQL